MRSSQPMPLVAACGMDDNLWIGDRITLDGRTFSVRGFDRMSLPEQTVELVETATGARARLPLAQLEAARLIRADAASWRWPQRARPKQGEMGDAAPGAGTRGADEGGEFI